MRATQISDMIDKAAKIPNTLTVATPPTVSDDTRQALKVQLNASGASLYRTLAGSQTATPTANAAETSSTEAYAKIIEVSVAAELLETKLTTAIRFTDNEVTLTAGSYTSWLGLGALLSPQQAGTVMATGNRVIVPDSQSAACGLLFPAGAVVTGNLFAQLALAPRELASVPCLVLIATLPAIMAGSNMVSFTELVAPGAGNARPTQPATTSWDFLNTTA